jgi:hypothetical protein
VPAPDRLLTRELNQLPLVLVLPPLLSTGVESGKGLLLGADEPLRSDEFANPNRLLIQSIKKVALIPFQKPAPVNCPCRKPGALVYSVGSPSRWVTRRNVPALAAARVTVNCEALIEPTERNDSKRSS